MTVEEEVYRVLLERVITRVPNDASVLPFKPLVDVDEMVAAIEAWFPNFALLEGKVVKYTVLSCFYAGRLHERGYRPGDDPNAPPPTRD